MLDRKWCLKLLEGNTSRIYKIHSGLQALLNVNNKFFR